MEREPQPPRRHTQIIRVSTWLEATAELKTVLDGRPATLGFTGGEYPCPMAIFYKDGWSGEGVGYYVWETKERRLDHMVADINLGAARRTAATTGDLETPPASPGSAEIPSGDPKPRTRSDDRRV